MLLNRLRIKVRTAINRCPRRLRALWKPLLGGLVGLIGGIPGFFVGLLLGYLLGELFGQTFGDKRIIKYLENPGAQQFHESEPGMAAWCALGVMVTAEEYSDSQPAEQPCSEIILKQVFIEACQAFKSPFRDPSQIEHFSRLAWSQRSRLNPDLLAESFAFRRAPLGDAGALGARLARLAESKKAKKLAGEILTIIEPGLTGETRIANDPWKILGLAPGTAFKEVKAHYRRLANQFHPDKLEVLTQQQRETASRAFIAIKEAYNQITTEC